MPSPGIKSGSRGTQFNIGSFEAFKRLELIAHSVVEGIVTGQHQSPLKGFAVEFEEHRTYTPGDDIKHLDWNVLAKTHRYYVRQYEQETSLRAYLVLDASGSMAYKSGTFSKLDYGRFVAGVLAYMLVGQEDSVGLVTCTSDIREFLPPRSTKTHLRNIMNTLKAAKAESDTGLGNVLHSLANRIRRRGLVMVISDLFDDPDDVAKALSHFAHKKHEVIVFQILDRQEATFSFSDMTRFESLEGDDFELTDPLRLRREYLRQFEEHQNRIRKTCHQLRIDFVQFFTDEPAERSLARYLAGRLKR